MVRVIVVQDAYGVLTCEQWCEKTYGGTWKQTSYTGKIRKNYAGIGYTFDEQRDAFIPPKPYESWVLDEETCQYKPPKKQPSDGKRYQWNEDIVDWELE